ncbi:coiled-coil domain-containing protein 81-like [Grus japonensis]|uniref:Coiled-coil domain-containing protein 81-like n=1 Tax=Grus japonensis TaxID=30415 RepID=A0ABC9XLP6_GRUJA
MVETCVRETVLLYSFQLRDGKRFSFAFRDIGVLACKGNILCVQFFYHCITGLESTASPVALVHSIRAQHYLPVGSPPSSPAQEQGGQEEVEEG